MRATKMGIYFVPDTIDMGKTRALFFLYLYNQIFKKHLIVLTRNIIFYNSNLANFLTRHSQ